MCSVHFVGLLGSGRRVDLVYAASAGSEACEAEVHAVAAVGIVDVVVVYAVQVEHKHLQVQLVVSHLLVRKCMKQGLVGWNLEFPLLRFAT